MDTMKWLLEWLPSTMVINSAIAVLAILVCWIERRERHLVWKISAVTGILGVLAILSGIGEEWASQAEATKLREQIKTANRNADKAILKLAPRADLLTADKRTALVAALKKIPTAKILLETQSNTPEAAQFGDLMYAVFTEAVCNVRRDSALLRIDGGRTARGVVVSYSGEEPSSDAKVIRDALIEAGVPDVALERQSKPAEVGAHVGVYVGPKDDTK